MADDELQIVVWRRLSVVRATTYRLLLAIIDGDQAAATAAIEHLLGQDRDAPPGTSPALELAGDDAYRIFELLAYIRDKNRLRWTNDSVRRGAHTLTRQRCPQSWRDEVLEVLDGLPGDSGRFPLKRPLHLGLFIPQLPNQIAAVCCLAWMFRDMSATLRKAARHAIDELLAGADEAVADPLKLGQRHQRTTESTTVHEDDAELRPVMAGSTMLIAYFGLAGDLSDEGILFAEPPADSREAQRQQVEEALYALKPLEIAGHADDAAEVLTWMAPGHVPAAVDHLIGVITGWLTESGFRPDPVVWFAGATSYLVPMVPPDYRDEAVRLLNPAGVTLGAMAPLDAWREAHREAHPVAALHATAALAAWLYVEPGAVHNPKQVAVDLAQRNLELGRQIGYTPPQQEMP